MPVLKRGGRKQYKARKYTKRVRKAGVPRGMRSKYADTHSFKLQAIDTSIINVGSGAGSIPKAQGNVGIGPATLASGGQNRYWFGGSFGFNLSQTLQYNQLNTLFDRYRINGIKVKVIPQFNVSETAGSGVIPVMRCVYDYDDNTFPAVGDVWSRRGIERRLDKPFSMYLKPKVLGLLYGSGGVNANSPHTAGYMDMKYGDVPHFGIKFGIKDWLCNTTPNTMVLRFEITYYVTVKNQIQVGRSLAEGETVVGIEEITEENVPCENQ